LNSAPFFLLFSSFFFFFTSLRFFSLPLFYYREIASLTSRLASINPAVFEGLSPDAFKAVIPPPAPFVLEPFDPDADEPFDDPPTHHDVARQKVYAIGL